MDALNNILENIKERIKTILAEQQESELFIRTREKMEELPPLAQKVIYGAAAFLFLMMILYWPLSNLMDSGDNNDQFNERRQVLKELLQVQRDVASGPNPVVGPPPVTLKGQFDQHLTAQGVKPEQIKESSEIPAKNVAGAQERGIMYRIEKLTIRQVVDLAYDMEHTDPSLKLQTLQITGSNGDPHYYDVIFKLVNYAPKMAELSSGLLDAAKKKGEKNDKKDEAPNK